MSDEKDYIAIGDIHGCALTNEKLLKQLDNQFGNSRSYLFLGDYTDRGPNSKQVITQLLDFKKNHDCIFLRGNHDQMLLDAYEDNKWTLWLRNGGETTLKNYDSVPGNFQLPEAHYLFFKNTLMYVDTENYFYVHGGIYPSLTIGENLTKVQDKSEFLWMRDHMYTENTLWEKTVVFGHTPVKDPVIKENMIGIDTGCVFKNRGYGKLTAIALPELEIFQQDCIDF